MGGRIWAGIGGWALAALLVSGTGCSGQSPEDRARLAQLEKDGDALTKSADELEERLMGNQAALELWAEMARRHQNVSAVSCKNQEQHLAGMVKYLNYQEDKGRKLKHHALASAEPVETEMVPRDATLTSGVARGGKFHRAK